VGHFLAFAATSTREQSRLIKNMLKLKNSIDNFFDVLDAYQVYTGYVFFFKMRNIPFGKDDCLEA
jgi:hypothetical protein